MIKELIFSGKKYYEGTMPNYLGKTLTEVGSYTYAISTSGSPNHFQMKKIEWSTTKGKIVGVLMDYKNNIYVSTGERDTGLNELWHKVSDLIQNGGVSHSLLTHLYQGLRHLLDKKVALIND